MQVDDSAYYAGMQRCDGTAGFFSPCSDAVSSSISASSVDFHQYSPDYSNDQLLPSPFSAMAQPLSSPTSSVPGSYHHHHRHHHHHQKRHGDASGSVYQNWTFAPTSRAQRRYVQPEVYAQRRATANLRERGRMSEMNRAFDRLRNLVPSYPACGRKMSKIDTLKLAKQYIHDLEKLVADGNVAEGYDFRLRLAEVAAQRARDGDSSDIDYSSSSSAGSPDTGDDSNASSLSSSMNVDFANIPTY